MDLSFPRFAPDAELSLLPGDLAVLMVGIAARQAASPTALAQAGIAQGGIADAELGAAEAQPRLFAPRDGAFNGTVAALLVRWKQE